MKILSLRKDEAKIKVDTPDDLWHLSRLIEPEDIVAGEIVRKVKIGGEEERSRLKRETYFVKINVEKVVFEPSAVRVAGTIAEGPEELALGSHHTLDVRLGDSIKIYKAWKQYQVKRLKEAEAATKMPSVAVCVLDDEAANLAEFTPTGIKYLAHLQLGLAKKQFADKAEERMGKLVAEVANLAKSHEITVIASPLFWKDEVLKRIKDKHSELVEKIKLEDTSTGGKRGVVELLKKGSTGPYCKRKCAAKRI